MRNAAHLHSTQYPKLVFIGTESLVGEINEPVKYQCLKTTYLRFWHMRLVGGVPNRVRLSVASSIPNVSIVEALARPFGHLEAP